MKVANSPLFEIWQLKGRKSNLSTQPLKKIPEHLIWWQIGMSSHALGLNENDLTTAPQHQLPQTFGAGCTCTKRTWFTLGSLNTEEAGLIQKSLIAREPLKHFLLSLVIYYSDVAIGSLANGVLKRLHKFRRTFRIHKPIIIIKKQFFILRRKTTRRF